MCTGTPISALQELTTSLSWAPPKYEQTSQISGTHKNNFEFTVTVADVRASGSGPSKQTAKHQAAKNALIKLHEEGKHVMSKVWLDGLNLPETCNGEKPDSDSILDLQNLCTEKCLPLPDYFEISTEGPPHCREFTYGCNIGSLVVEAKAGNKKVSKRLAAKNMLEKIKSLSDLELRTCSEMFTKLENRNLNAREKFMLLSNKSPFEGTDFTENPFPKLMAARGLTYEDLAEDLKTQTEESLGRITEKLGISYTLRQAQNQPAIASLNVSVKVPFAQMAVGNSYEDAKQKVLDQCFLILDSYIEKK